MSTSPLGGPRRRLQSVDWVSLRRAFIERPERPTLDALSTEFGVSIERISRAATDEGWAALRAAHLGERLKSADAALALLNAAKADGAITSAMTNAALEVIREVNGVVNRMGTRKLAENTRANTLNTCAFTLSNLANALARVGVVGLPKSLKESAGVSSGVGFNGRWDPQMLQQLNQTVQVIVQQAQPAPTAAIPAPAPVAEGQEPAPALAEPAGATIEVPAQPVDEPVAEDVL